MKLSKELTVLAVLAALCAAVLVGITGYAWSQEALELESEADAEELADLLGYLQDNPIDLNRASAVELAQLPWISPAQALRIHARLRGRPTSDPWSLVAEGILDQDTMERILPFISIEGKGPPPGLLTASSRWQRTWSRDTVEVPSPWANRQRLEYVSSDRWRLYLQTQKDREERDWTDFWSGAASYRTSGGDFEAVAGDYRLSSGMGLAFAGSSPRILNPGFFPKPAGRARATVHSSSSEVLALRGAAAAARFGDLRCLASASWRRVDGGTDSSGDLARIYDDGYHRTEVELARKWNAEEKLGFLSLGWEPSGQGWLEASAYAADYGPSPAESLYAGPGGGLAGVWEGALGYLSFELAAADGQHLAFSALAGTRRAGTEAALLVYAYQPGYRAPRFNGYERYGGSDEQGAMVFQKASLPLKSGVSALFHWYRPWSSRAEVDQGHGGFLLDLKAVNGIMKNLEAACRFKLRENERPWQSTEAVLLGRERSYTTKAMLDWSAGGGWVISTDYAWTRFRPAAGGLERGEMMSAGAGWSGGPGIRLRAQSSLYRTGSYDAAIYQPEPELRGSGSFHPLFGLGRRDALTVRYTHAKRLSVEIKLAYTHREYQGETTRQTELGIQAEIR